MLRCKYAGTSSLAARLLVWRGSGHSAGRCSDGHLRGGTVASPPLPLLLPPPLSLLLPPPLSLSSHQPPSPLPLFIFLLRLHGILCSFSSSTPLDYFRFCRVFRLLRFHRFPFLLPTIYPSLSKVPRQGRGSPPGSHTRLQLLRCLAILATASTTPYSYSSFSSSSIAHANNRSSHIRGNKEAKPTGSRMFCPTASEHARIFMRAFNHAGRIVLVLVRAL